MPKNVNRKYLITISSYTKPFVANKQHRIAGKTKKNSHITDPPKACQPIMYNIILQILYQEIATMHWSGYELNDSVLASINLRFCIASAVGNTHCLMSYSI